jgi:hypothetical protein
MGNAIVDELLQPAPAYESHSIGPNGRSFFSDGFRKWSCYCLFVFIGVCDENIAAGHSLGSASALLFLASFHLG